MYLISKKKTIEAAHKLEDSSSLITKQCLRLHGHRYEIEVTATANELNDAYMVVDFAVFSDIIQKYDHQYLNDFFTPTTAENFAKVLYNEIMATFFDRKVNVKDLSVSINETASGKVTYNGV